MNKEISRDFYLDQLIRCKHNRLIKVVTGMRRCGKSYLLNTLFKKHLLKNGIDNAHIINMAFDLFEYSPYRDPNLFYPWVLNQLKDNEMHYIILDEVQMLGDFVSVLNGLAAKDNCDVYVTGSNAKFLSKDIVTEFSGRSIEIKLYPLSFSEFISVYNGNEISGLRDYMLYGGIPLVALTDTIEEKKKILSSLVSETYLRDIILRNKVHNTDELKDLFNVLSSSVGCLMNPLKLQNTFKSIKHSKITAPTITKYIEHLKDAFIIEEAKRYDIKGKTYIGTPMKYYFTDVGLCNAQIDFRQEEVTQTMENIIYNELRTRGFHVDIGNLSVVEKNKTGTYTSKYVEIDFVCNKNSERIYIQSAYTLSGDGKYRQETRPFDNIRDAFKKVVITYDTPAPYYTEEGIYVTNIFDFLLKRDDL